MSRKIAIVGAGSAVFTLNVVRDIFTYPALAGSEIYLMDIDAEKLSLVEKLVYRIIREGGYKAELTTTVNRAEALRDADFVVNTAYVGGYETMIEDFRIMDKYNIRQCIGDTLGPDAVFRAQRAIPVFVEMANDIRKFASKDAWLINYSNPMAMITWAIIEATGINAVGLCHGVEQTLERLADYLNVKYKQLTHVVAGLNHQAWVLKLEHNGHNLLPRLKQLSEDPTVYRKDIVRWEIYRQLGYFCTESSGHDSEYNPWFRKRADLEAQYCSGFGFSGERGFHLKLYMPEDRAQLLQMEMLAKGQGYLDLGRSREYCAGIINAIVTGEKYHFNGNVININLIGNLPGDCCVEVPCIADDQGVHPQKVGDLPLQLAALNQMQIMSQRLAVRGALELDQELVFQSLCYDPLTSAVLSLQEIRQMTVEMFEVYPEYLPKYKKLLRRLTPVLKFDYESFKTIQSMPKQLRFEAENIIDQYFIAGPFSAAGKGELRGLNLEHSPEKCIDLDAVMKCPYSGREVSWRPICADDLESNGMVNLLKQVGIEPYSIAYALTALKAEKQCKINLLVGSDEGIAIWLNGRLIHFHDVSRPIDRDQDSVSLSLSKGINFLLFKISQTLGYWGFIARLEQKPQVASYLNTFEISHALSGGTVADAV
ncbi:MAG: alpha-galactosidase [Planctomycetota bacterium]